MATLKIKPADSTTPTLTDRELGVDITVSPPKLYVGKTGTNTELSGTATLADNSVTDAKLRDSAACSVIGRSANSAGDPADIAAASNGHYLKRAGDVVGFGAIAAGDLPAITGLSHITSGSIDGNTLFFLNEAGSNAYTELSNLTASVADMEAGTTNSRMVVPQLQHRHPSAAKGWVRFDGTGTIAIDASYNVSSITDLGTGFYTVNWDTDFSSANYCVVAATGTSGVRAFVDLVDETSQSAGGSTVFCSSGGAGTDCNLVCVVAFGDQA